MPPADLFTSQAENYAKYRPQYPDTLFAYLASQVPRRERAWDCATGTGQAALALAPFFERIIATDRSEKQIINAARHPQITYVLEAVEHTSIESASIDLVTVAQALHWLELDQFYREVRRVLRPGGVIAVWTFSFRSVRLPDSLNKLIKDFYLTVLKPYWPRHFQEERERPFPFQELSMPPFEMEATWDLEELTSFINTLSSVRRYRAETGKDPVQFIVKDMEEKWGPATRKEKITWPLNMRVGRLNKSKRMR